MHHTVNGGVICNLTQPFVGWQDLNGRSVLAFLSSSIVVEEKYSSPNVLYHVFGSLTPFPPAGLTDDEKASFNRFSEEIAHERLYDSLAASGFKMVCRKLGGKLWVIQLTLGDACATRHVNSVNLLPSSYRGAFHQLILKLRSWTFIQTGIFCVRVHSDVNMPESCAVCGKQTCMGACVLHIATRRLDRECHRQIKNKAFSLEVAPQKLCDLTLRHEYIHVVRHMYAYSYVY